MPQKPTARKKNTKSKVIFNLSFGERYLYII